MKTIVATIVLTIILIGLTFTFVVPAYGASKTVSAKTATIEITSTTTATHNGLSGTAFVIRLNGSQHIMFAALKPFETGRNQPNTGTVTSFIDQMCLPIIGCGGNATFKQGMNSYSAYRIQSP